MKKIVILIPLLILAWWLTQSGTNNSSKGHDVLLSVTVPDSTPTDAKLSLGGDFNGWNPTDSNYQLKKVDTHIYQYRFENVEPGKVLNFKVTRGNWDTVEIAESGANRDNRYIAVNESVTAVEIEVADWADLTTKVAPSTIVGIYKEHDWELPTFAGQRNVRVYLPSDYENSDLRYPVIYMSDAQNLFDSKTANAGEWQMDELMEKLQAQGSALTSIVVGVDHAGENRGAEYLPVESAGWKYQSDQKGIPQGQVFADWLVDDLKPFIDNTYRTKPEREHTTMMGSSMGGLISCYVVLAHQETFSKAACLSSAFLKKLVGENWLTYIKQQSKRADTQFYMDMGDNEFGLFGPDILKETQQVHDAMISIGFAPTELKFAVVKGGTHDEQSWRNRTESILTWLNGQ